MEKIFRKIAGMAIASTKISKVGLIISAIFIVAFTVSLVPLSVYSQEGKSVKAFTAILTGGQEVPQNESNAFGVAFITFEEDEKLLFYSITFTDTNLIGSETAAHFHGPANPGENAPILFAITPVPGSPKVGSIGPLKGKEIRDLKKGLLYLNIHTDEFPNGEIRGQVLPVRGINFKDVSEGG